MSDSTSRDEPVAGPEDVEGARKAGRGKEQDGKDRPARTGISRLPRPARDARFGGVFSAVRQDGEEPGHASAGRRDDHRHANPYAHSRGHGRPDLDPYEEGYGYRDRPRCPALSGRDRGDFGHRPGARRDETGAYPGHGRKDFHGRLPFADRHFPDRRPGNGAFRYEGYGREDASGRSSFEHGPRERRPDSGFRAKPWERGRSGSFRSRDEGDGGFPYRRPAPLPHGRRFGEEGGREETRLEPRTRDRSQARQEEAPRLGHGGLSSHGREAFAPATRDVRPVAGRREQASAGHEPAPARVRRAQDGVYDVLILGAGAAGLACAARCRELGLSVCVVDRAREPGRKLSLAGGGRVNFTNRHLSPNDYLCSRPDFVPPVLENFGWRDALALVEGLELPWEEREGGRLFLKVPGSEFVKALVSVCRGDDFSLCLSEVFHPRDIRLEGRDGGVSLSTRDGTRRRARRLVVALGSPACPFSGSSGMGYALAQALGHGLVTPEAALTPLVLPEGSELLGLQGVSVPVTLATCQRSFAGNLLFTHDALSGPVALKASLFWQKEAPVTINFLPTEDVEALLSDSGAGRGTPRSVLSRHLPQALVDKIVPEDLRSRRCAEIARATRNELAARIKAYRLTPAGLAGLRRAEVCRGGVDTREIDPLSFASRLHPEVQFVGEVLDVTGLLGGYNLHWAFASGCLAAEALRGALR